MTRKQMNIRLDEMTRQAIKAIAEKYNMSESQVVTRGVILLEQELKTQNAMPIANAIANKRATGGNEQEGI